MRLGDRMKRYEYVSRTYLTRRLPVIIRLDGKAFHTFTKGFNKPFDRVMMTTMQDTMMALCSNIQGCVFGYTQSDEITLVLVDYQNINTDAWFGYNIQKMASVSASIATMAFNKFFIDNTECAIQYYDSIAPVEATINFDESVYKRKFNKAVFDSRVFSVPKDEVCNCLIWRQQDATRNSIESAGQKYFSHTQLKNKSCDDIQEMLFQEKGINWNNYPTAFKRGSACYRKKEEVETIEASGEKELAIRNRWFVDENIPIFTQDRAFIEKWIDF